MGYCLLVPNLEQDLLQTFTPGVRLRTWLAVASCVGSCGRLVPLFKGKQARVAGLDAPIGKGRLSASTPLTWCRRACFLITARVIESDSVATHEGFDTSAVWEGRNSSPAEVDGDADEPEEAETT